MKLEIVINYQQVNYKKFKKSKLHIDKDIYNVARYKVRKMIFDKKRSYFENELSESIGKLKHLMEGIKIPWVS